MRHCIHCDDQNDDQHRQNDDEHDQMISNVKPVLAVIWFRKYRNRGSILANVTIHFNPRFRKKDN